MSAPEARHSQRWRSFLAPHQYAASAPSGKLRMVLEIRHKQQSIAISLEGSRLYCAHPSRKPRAVNYRAETVTFDVVSARVCTHAADQLIGRGGSDPITRRQQTQHSSVFSENNNPHRMFVPPQLLLVATFGFDMQRNKLPSAHKRIGCIGELLHHLLP